MVRCLSISILKSCSPIPESTLHLVLRLRGGAKKRKKKNYTTPKKIKHKHKKVKLAVLKYYKVCVMLLFSLVMQEWGNPYEIALII